MAIKEYQNAVNQVAIIFKTQFGVINSTGIITASSDESVIGTQVSNYEKLAENVKEEIEMDGCIFRKISVKKKSDGFTYVRGTDKILKDYLVLFTSNIVNVKNYHDDKHDKYYFLKSILLDNVLPGDIYLRARELKLAQNATRVVYSLKTLPKFDKLLFDLVNTQFPDREKDYVIHVDDGEIVLVRELNEKFDIIDISKLANKLETTIEANKISNFQIGIGTVVNSLRDLGRSFREAQMAQDIGDTFIGGKRVYNYNSLGIGRLIFQLPKTLCKLFLREVFSDEIFNEIDEETLSTVKIFFDNNLNVSETSRQLYVHRNTLVYRLDKIQKLTKLDLRMFDDAITFKVAILVKKYLDRDVHQ